MRRWWNLRSPWVWLVCLLALVSGAWGVSALLALDDAPRNLVIIRKMEADQVHKEDAYPLDPSHVEVNAPGLAAALRHAAREGVWMTPDRDEADAIWSYLERTTGKGYPWSLVAFEGALFKVSPQSTP